MWNKDPFRHYVEIKSFSERRWLQEEETRLNVVCGLLLSGLIYYIKEKVANIYFAFEIFLKLFVLTN